MHEIAPKQCNVSNIGKKYQMPKYPSITDTNVSIKNTNHVPRQIHPIGKSPSEENENNPTNKSTQNPPDHQIDAGKVNKKMENNLNNLMEKINEKIWSFIYKISSESSQLHCGPRKIKRKND